VNPNEDAPYNQGHPEALMYYGGLNHLPDSYAAGVVATKTVPTHVCCYSPFWIYRIFQDTWIDSNEIIKLIRQG
jgi:protein O-mannose beta-1,4-N-acetylglucosaminyltransferase